MKNAANCETCKKIADRTPTPRTSTLRTHIATRPSTRTNVHILSATPSPLSNCRTASHDRLSVVAFRTVHARHFALVASSPPLLDRCAIYARSHRVSCAAAASDGRRSYSLFERRRREIQSGVPRARSLAFLRRARAHAVPTSASVCALSCRLLLVSERAGCANARTLPMRGLRPVEATR